MKIIPEDELRLSPVVANCRMNRKRKLTGINSYQKEIGIDIGAYLESKATGDVIRWLDICCGEGNALIELAKRWDHSALQAHFKLTGIDLVGMFHPYNPQELPNLELRECAFEEWESSVQYDLITCIHGLHYIGDKLGMLQRISQLLKNDGRFYGNLDLQNIRLPSGKSAEKWVRHHWKEIGWEYHVRKKLLLIAGNKNEAKRWKYVGADDQAGPNYTGQEVINSYYELIE